LQQAVEQSSEPLAAAPVGQHAGVADSNAQLQQQSSSSSHAAATSLYLALAGGLAVAGLLVATFAAPIAASSLNLGSLPLQQAAALVGCGGAALLRAASLAVFLAVSAEPGRFGWCSHAVRVNDVCALIALQRVQLDSTCIVVAAGVMISAKACNLYGSRMARCSIAQLANTCPVVVCVAVGVTGSSMHVTASPTLNSRNCSKDAV
jgi:hypothetical protein